MPAAFPCGTCLNHIVKNCEVVKFGVTINCMDSHLTKLAHKHITIN